MRLGVLDVGPRTAHPLVVGDRRGGHTHTRERTSPDSPQRREVEELCEHPHAEPARSGTAGRATGAAAVRVPRLEIRPWALREGVILRTLDGTAQIDRSAQDAPERLGRLTTYEARCTG